MEYVSLGIEAQQAVLKERLANYEKQHFEACCMVDELTALGEEKRETYSTEIRKIESYGKIIALLKLKLETLSPSTSLVMDGGPIFIGDDE